MSTPTTRIRRRAPSSLASVHLAHTCGGYPRSTRDRLFAHHVLADLAQLPAVWSLPGPRGAPPYVSDVAFDA
eukprot:CAMPEP_0115878272 /NCGR_PEP_ID=MMETSP0287-20121206/26685_1 /TAXON_ID=412157 /ORGANISM="Chrysochromulina rotalis, Strain UIO044" /LENGTH=71 /DNA_ID=CAMNT_0003333877 /DNA_START=213 /DNA_END=425 /DNA_ORIENTATION=+